MANDTPVISHPFADNEAPPTVNTLSGNLLPTLNSSPADDVETVNSEEVAD